MADMTPTAGNAGRTRRSPLTRSWRRALAAFCVSLCALVGQGATAQQATTSAEANSVLIRNAYDAFSRGDIDAVMAVFAPDIV